MRLRALVVFAAGLAASVALLAQAPRMDGKWEVTGEMEMPGMTMKLPVSTRCITKEEAADPQKAAPKGPGGRGGEESNCKVADYKIVGNKVTFTMKCEGEQPMTMAAEMIYTGDTYTATQKMEMGGRGNMTIKSTGKRLGDCEK